MTKIGYARVSTEGQNLDLQVDALRRAGCTCIFQEKITGASRKRPALEDALAILRPGDSLVVWKLDRLGRSFQHLVSVIQTLEDDGKGFLSISDAIDTTTSTGKLMFHIIGAIAEFERSLISERTRAGLAAAKRRGKKLGRPRLLTSAQIETALALVHDEQPLPIIAKALTVSRTTLWRALEERKAA